MAVTGDVEITIADGGGSVVVVPQASVFVVAACSSAGTPDQPFATRSIPTLTSTFGYGEGVEAAARMIANGGTVIFNKLTQTAAGTASAVTFAGTGTSVITLTLDGTVGAFDHYLAKLVVVKGGTIGVAGITFTLSLDGGKTFGPTIALGTSSTYVIPNTGITLNFAAGTLVAADTAKFTTVSPDWGTSNVQSAINALGASPYALTGWGGMLLTGIMSGAECSTIDGYMTTLLSTYKIPSRVIGCARDGILPVAWGGAGETEATWIASLQSDYLSVSAKRMVAAAGFYPTPSSIANAAAGSPRYRRSLGIAAAVRAVAVPPQRHIGRVRDGGLEAINVDATLDPFDGFIYHDERWNPGLTGSRFMAARTRKSKQGWFVDQPNLMAPTGSDFTLLPIGNVMDVGTTISYQVGQDAINDDLRTNDNGTIYENDAQQLEKVIRQALDDNMTNQKMITKAEVTIDRTNNVKNTSKVLGNVKLYRRAYIGEFDITLQVA